MSDDWRADLHTEMEASRSARRQQTGKPYNDRRWRRRSQEFLFSHPTCLACGAPSEVCDHVVPLSTRNDDPLLSPVQALCLRCHGVKWKLEQAFKRGEVSEADLVMDSTAAQKMRKSRLGCDLDGMPLNPDHPWRQTINARKGLK